MKKDSFAAVGFFIVFLFCVTLNNCSKNTTPATLVDKPEAHPDAAPQKSSKSVSEKTEQIIAELTTRFEQKLKRAKLTTNEETEVLNKLKVASEKIILSVETEPESIFSTLIRSVFDSIQGSSAQLKLTADKIDSVSAAIIVSAISAANVVQSGDLKSKTMGSITKNALHSLGKLGVDKDRLGSVVYAAAQEVVSIDHESASYVLKLALSAVLSDVAGSSAMIPQISADEILKSFIQGAKQTEADTSSLDMKKLIEGLTSTAAAAIAEAEAKSKEPGTQTSPVATASPGTVVAPTPENPSQFVLASRSSSSLELSWDLLPTGQRSKLVLAVGTTPL